jgi:hypothetical protein
MIFRRTTKFFKPYNLNHFIIHNISCFIFSIIIISIFCKFESSRTNETIIESEYCDIFPNQVFMKEIPLTETMEGNKSLQT